jgi:hypothetical protein
MKTVYILSDMRDPSNVGIIGVYSTIEKAKKEQCKN